MPIPEQVRNVLFDITWNESLRSFDSLIGYYQKKRADAAAVLEKFDAALFKVIDDALAIEKSLAAQGADLKRLNTEMGDLQKKIAGEKSDEQKAHLQSQLQGLKEKSEAKKNDRVPLTRQKEELVESRNDLCNQRDACYQDYISTTKILRTAFGEDVKDEYGDVNSGKLGKLRQRDEFKMPKTKAEKTVRTVLWFVSLDDSFRKSLESKMKSLEGGPKDQGYVLEIERFICGYPWTKVKGEGTKGSDAPEKDAENSSTVQDSGERGVYVNTGLLLLRLMKQSGTPSFDLFIDLDYGKSKELDIKDAGCCGRQAFQLMEKLSLKVTDHGFHCSADPYELYKFRYDLVADFLSAGDEDSTRSYVMDESIVSCASSFEQSGNDCARQFSDHGIDICLKNNIVPKLSKNAVVSTESSKGKAAIHVFLKHRFRRLALNLMMANEVQYFDPNIGDASCELRPAFIFWAHERVRGALETLAGVGDSGALAEKMILQFNRHQKDVPWESGDIRSVSVLTNCGPEGQDYYEFFLTMVAGINALDSDIEPGSASMGTTTTTGSPTTTTTTTTMTTTTTGTTTTTMTAIGSGTDNKGHDTFDHMYHCLVLGHNRRPVREGMGNTTGGHHNVERKVTDKPDLKEMRARLGDYTVMFMRYAARKVAEEAGTNFAKQVSNVLNICNVHKKINKGRNIPILPIYSGQRAATMYAFLKGAPLILNVTRLRAEPGTDQDNEIYAKAAEISGNKMAAFNYQLQGVRLFTYMPNRQTGAYELVEDEVELKNISKRPAYFATGYSLCMAGDSLPANRPGNETFFYTESAEEFFAGFKKMDPMVHIIMGAAKHPPFDSAAAPVSKDDKIYEVYRQYHENVKNNPTEFDQIYYLGEKCFGLKLTPEGESRLQTKGPVQIVPDKIQFGAFVNNATPVNYVDGKIRIYGDEAPSVNLIDEIVSHEAEADKLNMEHGTYALPIMQSGKASDYMCRRDTSIYYYTQHIHVTTLEFEQRRNAKLQIGRVDARIYDAEDWVKKEMADEAAYLADKFKIG